MKPSKVAVTAGGSLVSALLSFLPLTCCIFPVAFSFLGALCVRDREEDRLSLFQEYAGNREHREISRAILNWDDQLIEAPR